MSAVTFASLIILGVLSSGQTRVIGEPVQSRGDILNMPRVSPQCTLCLLFIKKLEDMLPKERTEDTIVKLMGQICDLLPGKYKDQCNNFTSKYGKQIVDFVLSSAAPHTVCMLLHLCLFQETPAVETAFPSDCDSCRTLSVLTRFHSGQNATELQTSDLLRKICLLHPNAIPECEVFTQLYGPRLQRIIGKQAGPVDVCKNEVFCQGYM